MEDENPHFKAKLLAVTSWCKTFPTPWMIWFCSHCSLLNHDGHALKHIPLQVFYNRAGHHNRVEVASCRSTEQGRYIFVYTCALVCLDSIPKKDDHTLNKANSSPWECSTTMYLEERNRNTTWRLQQLLGNGPFGSTGRIGHWITSSTHPKSKRQVLSLRRSGPCAYQAYTLYVVPIHPRVKAVDPRQNLSMRALGHRTTEASIAICGISMVMPDPNIRPVFLGPREGERGISISRLQYNQAALDIHYDLFLKSKPLRNCTIISHEFLITNLFLQHLTGSKHNHDQTPPTILSTLFISPDTSSKRHKSLPICPRQVFRNSFRMNVDRTCMYVMWLNETLYEVEQLKWCPPLVFMHWNNLTVLPPRCVSWTASGTPKEPPQPYLRLQKTCAHTPIPNASRNSSLYGCFTGYTFTCKWMSCPTACSCSRHVNVLPKVASDLNWVLGFFWVICSSFKTLLWKVVLVDILFSRKEVDRISQPNKLLLEMQYTVQYNVWLQC